MEMEKKEPVNALENIETKGKYIDTLLCCHPVLSFSLITFRLI
jgi:hypothetical protein